MEIIKQYDKIGKKYLEGQKEYFSKQIDQSREFIKKRLPTLKGKIVLDLGCGGGNDIISYKKIGAKEVFGIDSSEYMIKEAKKLLPNNKDKLFVCNMENTPFKDETFDVIIGRFSIHYLKNIDNAYIELSRILKRGGKLILVVHHPFLIATTNSPKDYNSNKIVSIKLYYSKVKLIFPHHPISDFFSNKFFENFYLNYVEEENIKKEVEYQNKNNIPSFLAFEAIKR